MRRLPLMGLCLLAAFLLCGCTQKPLAANDTAYMLDTICTVDFFDVREGEAIISDCFEEGRRLEALLSEYVDESEVSALNRSAGVAPVSLSEETADLLGLGIHYAVLSNGLFDITIQPLAELWSISPPEGHVPSAEELSNTLPLIDYQRLELEGQSGFLTESGMGVTLGGIAKGYIADKMKEQALSNGVQSGIINLGGNILLIGQKDEGLPFTVGIQSPDSTRGDYLGTVSASDVSIVTSGSYERYFEENGTLYHHILNPFTGYPSDTDLRSVTVISARSVDGDALSTTAFLLGSDAGLQLIESLDQVEAVFVLKDDTIRLSSGAAGQFTLVDDQFSIVR